MTVTQTETPLEQPTHDVSLDLTDRQEASADETERTSASSARPTFTITDAATACGVSRKTITRKLAELALHGAAKDDDGIWRIPVEALLAVGLHPGRSLPRPESAPRAAAPSPQPAPAAVAPVEGATDVVSIPRHRWDDLRIRLARAEAEASERALALADARLALRALTAGPAAYSGAPGPASAQPVAAGASLATAQVPSGAVVAAGPAPAPAVTVLGGSPAVVAPAAPVEDQGAPAAVTSVELGDAEARLAAARTHAAQNGGYVPATPAAPVRKRRWWHSK